jgi:hypothetical protein
MPKVLFTETRKVQDEKRDTKDATIYEAGKVYELPQESVNRWVSRKIATTDEDLIAAAEDEDEKETVRPSTRPDSKSAPDSSSGAEVIAKNPELSKAAEKAPGNSTEENLITQSSGRLQQVATSQNTPVASPTVAGRR